MKKEKRERPTQTVDQYRYCVQTSIFQPFDTSEDLNFEKRYFGFV